MNPKRRPRNPGCDRKRSACRRLRAYTQMSVIWSASQIVSSIDPVTLPSSHPVDMASTPESITSRLSLHSLAFFISNPLVIIVLDPLVQYRQPKR